MKKWSLCFGVGTLMMLMVGCQRNMDFVSLGVSIEDFVSKGKVYVDEERYACWMNGDRVNINGEGYTVNVDGNGSKIEQVKWNESGYTAVYPAEYTKAVATDKVVINGPNSYQYRTKNVEGVDKQVLLNPMVARTGEATGNLMFRNVGALVGVKLKNDASAAITIDKIQLQATQAELSGEATVTNIDGAESTISIAGGGDNMVLWGINKEIAQTKNDIFYLSIPPVSTEGNQFKVRVIFHVGEQYYEFNRTTNTTAGTIGKNQLGIIPIDLTTIVGADTYISESNGLMGEGKSGNPYIIADNGDLTRLKNFCNTSSTNQLYVQQVADLACSSDWMGIGTKNGNVIYAFKGHYDGGGFSVNMDDSPSGLFNYIGDNTEIKNLTITGTISANSSQYIGGIVNIANGVKTSLNFINCTNIATINLNKENPNPTHAIGGLCGYIQSSDHATFEKCTNKGSITCSVGIGITSQVYIGGLCGYIGSPTITTAQMQFNQCKNEGEITFTQGTNYKIGGLLGYGKSNTTMNQCVNKGNLNGDKRGQLSDVKLLGGMIGQYSREGYLKLTECVNHGNMNTCYGAGGLIGSVESCSNFEIMDCYADNKFLGCDHVGGICYKYYIIQNTLIMSDVYVNTNFDDQCTNKSWIINDRRMKDPIEGHYDHIYIPNTSTCGIISTNRNMNQDSDEVDDIFLINMETLASDLNHGRDIWEKTIDGKVRLKFEGMGN